MKLLFELIELLFLFVCSFPDFDNNAYISYSCLHLECHELLTVVVNAKCVKTEKCSRNTVRGIRLPASAASFVRVRRWDRRRLTAGVAEVAGRDGRSLHRTFIRRTMHCQHLRLSPGKSAACLYERFTETWLLLTTEIFRIFSLSGTKNVSMILVFSLLPVRNSVSLLCIVVDLARFSAAPTLKPLQASIHLATRQTLREGWPCLLCVVNQEEGLLSTVSSLPSPSFYSNLYGSEVIVNPWPGNLTEPVSIVVLRVRWGHESGWLLLRAAVASGHRLKCHTVISFGGY